MSPVETRGGLIIHEKDFPILPKDINVESINFGNFRHPQTEQAARYVVPFSARLGGWKPFTSWEINDFCRGVTNRGFSFGGLVESLVVWDRHEPIEVDGGYLARRGGFYYVTTALAEEIMLSQIGKRWRPGPSINRYPLGVVSFGV